MTTFLKNKWLQRAVMLLMLAMTLLVGAGNSFAIDCTDITNYHECFDLPVAVHVWIDPLGPVTDEYSKLSEAANEELRGVLGIREQTTAIVVVEGQAFVMDLAHGGLAELNAEVDLQYR